MRDGTHVFVDKPHLFFCAESWFEFSAITDTWYLVLFSQSYLEVRFFRALFRRWFCGVGANANAATSPSPAPELIAELNSDAAGAVIAAPAGESSWLCCYYGGP